MKFSLSVSIHLAISIVYESLDGFTGKHYCPRMASMNKTVFQSILTHSPTKPVLIFVSSRRQTRITAKALISLCAASVLSSGNARRFLRMDEDEIEAICATQVHDSSLKMSLSFGIGLHHAGLDESDRSIVESLFIHQKIQILIATSTVAWGVNFPAHLVVVKGTEYFDAASGKYVDFPITDVLQMIGRAGRPQYDSVGKAHVLVQDVKKSFYKKFLHQPFPVESSLHLPRNLHDHLNAEISSNTIQSLQHAMDYLTWTYFYRRLKKNPSYYELIPSAVLNASGHGSNCDSHQHPGQQDQSIDDAYAHVTDRDIAEHLSRLVLQCFEDLETSECIQVVDDKCASLCLGRISSFYYLKHTTLRLFKDALTSSIEFDGLLKILSLASEYDEVAVRHNEDLMNKVCAFLVLAVDLSPQLIFVFKYLRHQHRFMDLLSKF